MRCGPLQREALAVASRRPPLVSRRIGQPAGGYVGLSVPAKEYQAAGGKLTAEEEHELTEWEQLQVWQAQQAAAGGGAAAVLRQRQLGGARRAGAAMGGASAAAAGGAAAGGRPALPPVYEVTAADVESSGFELDCPSLSWSLTDGEYEDSWAFFHQLTKLAHPHLAAAIAHQVGGCKACGCLLLHSCCCGMPGLVGGHTECCFNRTARASAPLHAPLRVATPEPLHHRVFLPPTHMRAA